MVTKPPIGIPPVSTVFDTHARLIELDKAIERYQEHQRSLPPIEAGETQSVIESFQSERYLVSRLATMGIGRHDRRPLPPGDDKTLETCKARFENVEPFEHHPPHPGLDALATGGVIDPEGKITPPGGCMKCANRPCVCWRKNPNTFAKGGVVPASDYLTDQGVIDHSLRIDLDRANKRAETAEGQAKHWMAMTARMEEQVETAEARVAELERRVAELVSQKGDNIEARSRSVDLAAEYQARAHAAEARIEELEEQSKESLLVNEKWHDAMLKERDRRSEVEAKLDQVLAILNGEAESGDGEVEND